MVGVGFDVVICAGGCYVGFSVHSYSSVLLLRWGCAGGFWVLVVYAVLVWVWIVGFWVLVYAGVGGRICGCDFWSFGNLLCCCLGLLLFPGSWIFMVGCYLCWFGFRVGLCVSGSAIFPSPCDLWFKRWRFCGRDCLTRWF